MLTDNGPCFTANLFRETCLELGSMQDRWSMAHIGSNAKGVLTIFHTPGEDGGKEYSGWDWEGDPSLVNADGTATDDLQELIDCVSGYYEG